MTPILSGNQTLHQTRGDSLGGLTPIEFEATLTEQPLTLAA